PERGVGRDRDRERRVDARQLLDAERVGERVAAGAALGLRDGHAEQAELGCLPQLGEREAAVRVEFLGDGRDHALGKAAHRVAEQPVLVREVEIHSLHDTGPTTMRRVDAGSLARYADAIVRDGLLIGSGDVLAVHPEPIQREFAIALTEAGYRAGARYVDVLEVDPRITRARALGAPEETLDDRPAWEDARMRELVREGAGLVWIAGSEDPQVLADVPPARAVRRVVDRPGLPVYRRAVGRADGRFAVVAWPSPAWAAQVYPELAPAAAVAALGDDLLRFARLGAGDPPDGWRRHAEALTARAARLTALDLRTIRLRAPGTDLELALPEGASWHGGVIEVRGRRITPNIPTEEVFTSPAPQATSGPFRCTRPLAIAGRVITGIAGEFRR